MDYCRQEILFGKKGQSNLKNSKVVIVGCGGTGSIILANLVRAGIKRIRVIDYDVVDVTNLHRMPLFNESDLDMSKAEVIADKFGVEGIFDKLDGSSLYLLDGFDLIMDGTDNLKTRFLINDYSIKKGVPWIYSGAIQSRGVVGFFEGKSPCFNCVFEGARDVEKCSTHGVMNSAVITAGSIASGEAQKFLARKGKVLTGLLFFDLFRNSYEIVNIKSRSDCRVCQG